MPTPTITATAPASLPRWADGTHGHAASVTEPTELLKDTGWVSPNPPAAANMNWLQNLAYTWAQYANSALSQLDTGKLAIDGSAAFNGTFKPATDGMDLGTLTGPKRWDAFLKTVRVDQDLTVLGDIHHFGFLLAEPSGSHQIGAVGYEWDAVLNNVSIAGTFTIGDLFPTANGDNLGDGAPGGNRWDAFLNGCSILGVLSVNTVGTALIPDITGRDIGNTAKRWDAFLGAVDINGICKVFQLDMEGAGAVSAATGIKNQLVRELIPKAWCTFDFDTTPNTTTYIDGNNISTIVYSAGPGEATITFAEAMLNALYSVIVSVDDGGALPSITKATGTIVLTFPAARASTRFNVQVMGRQP